MEEVEETSATFPDKWKQAFEGLLYLGYLEKEVEIPFHKFVVRTLTVSDKLEISLLTGEYVDTIGYGRAYRAACVAAALVSVDGRPLIAASKDISVLRQKYEYVINSWYDAVIDVLYQAVDELEAQVLIVLQELDILKTPTPQPIFKDEQESDDDPKDGTVTPT